MEQDDLNKNKDSVKVSKNKKKKKRKKTKKQMEEEKGKVEQENETNGVDSEVEVEYVQESVGLHELAPQYRQFFHILEAFKIADIKPDIPPPMLATPTSLSSKATAALAGDQFQDENEEGEEVNYLFLTFFSFT